jgi:hypothetical protein
LFHHHQRPRATARTLCYHEIREYKPIGSTKCFVTPASILARRILTAAVTALAFTYFADYLYLRVRMLHAKQADPFETLKSLRVLAIPEKNGKTEYEVDTQNPEQTVICVHSLFPHSGYSPCWNVKPRINQPIPM